MEHDGGSWTPTDDGTMKTTRGKKETPLMRSAVAQVLEDAG